MPDLSDVSFIISKTKLPIHLYEKPYGIKMGGLTVWFSPKKEAEDYASLLSHSNK